MNLGNCRGKTAPREEPHHSFEVHKSSKHALRFGLETGKNPQGKITLGVRGGLDCESNKVIKVEDDETEDVNKIPKVLDIVKDDRVNSNPEQ